MSFLLEHNPLELHERCWLPWVTYRLLFPMSEGLGCNMDAPDLEKCACLGVGDVGFKLSTDFWLKFRWLDMKYDCGSSEWLKTGGRRKKVTSGPDSHLMRQKKVKKCDGCKRDPNVMPTSEMPTFQKYQGPDRSKN